MKAREKWDLVMLNSKTLKDFRALNYQKLRLLTDTKYYKISLSNNVRTKEYVAK